MNSGLNIRYDPFDTCNFLQNPAKPNPGNPNIGLDNKADFGEKQKLFEGTPGGYAWIAAKVKYSSVLLTHGV